MICASQTCFWGELLAETIASSRALSEAVIRDIAQTRMRYGYLRIYILLRREGWIVNHKRVYRLYREDGLSLRLKRPRRHISAVQRERQPAATSANDLWAMDFVPTRCSTVDDFGR